MRLLARLKLGQKLLICSAAFLLPLAVLLYYTLSGFQQQIQFTDREIEGVSALQPLCNLAILLSRRQEDSIVASVDSLIADLRKAETKTGVLLPPAADASWRSLKAAGPNTAIAETARRELLQHVYAAFERLTETTNLILDPELDSYHLADLALLRVPSLHEALSRDSAATLSRRELETVKRGVAVAVRENRRRHAGGSSLQTNLPRALSAFESAVGKARLDAVSALWKTAVMELGVLLNERATALRRKGLTALFLTLTGVVFAGTMLFLVVRTAAIPLARATGIAEQIAAGRLKAAEATLSGMAIQNYAIAPGNGCVRDEAFRLLGAFGTMAETLDSLLNGMRDSCSEVDASGSQMVTALHQLEATVTEQAASTNQVVATSKEIFATVQELAQNMHAVTGMAADAANLASAGLSSLNSINAAMQDTLEGAASVSHLLNAISAKAANINRVLTAITNIANRTNLLSLNAAIEAEKAGEHAAGFTVVGLEIRRVADQTAVAALDIEKMLGEMQSAVSEGTRSMAEYAERSRGNSETVASITADLRRSIEYTRNLEPHFEAVNNGMQMQSQAASQILEAMQQLSTVAAQTRDSLARFREIAEHMRATVEVLQGQVARFSVA